MTYSPQFESILAFILKWEGGDTVTHDPRDSGGVTKFGVSQKAYPELDIESLTLEQAKAIYKRDYYDNIWGDSLPYSIALVVTDFAVNGGIRTAVKALQRLVGTESDGLFGIKTQDAVRKLDQDGIDRLIDTYTLARNDHYLKLVKEKPNFSVFVRGWLNRSNAAARAAHKGLV
jgi:lysozyme family protein